MITQECMKRVVKLLVWLFLCVFFAFPLFFFLSVFLTLSLTSFVAGTGSRVLLLSLSFFVLLFSLFVLPFLSLSPFLSFFVLPRKHSHDSHDVRLLLVSFSFRLSVYLRFFFCNYIWSCLSIISLSLSLLIPLCLPIFCCMLCVFIYLSLLWMKSGWKICSLVSLSFSNFYSHYSFN